MSIGSDTAPRGKLPGLLPFRPGNNIFLMMKFVYAVLLLGIVMSLAYGAIIKDRPSAVSNGSDIYVRWNTEDESTVASFAVLRRAGTEGDFVEISSVPPKGDFSSYEYIDRSVFKSSGGVYQYVVRVRTGPTTYLDTQPVTVAHISSTAKRTWGSIKAMFR